MKKKVSVVVPIYKVEKYLERCVNSIIKQTYRNLEIILVDDGSTDRCPQICDEMAQRDSRIKVIHQSNGGLSCARNTGIEVATGDYLALIDSDDWIHEQFIEELYNICEKYHCDIAQCDYLSVDTDKIEIPLSNFNNVFVYNNLEALEKCCIDGDAVKYIVAWNKLYSRKLFENIEYPNGKLHEDEFTTYKLFYKASKVCTTNLCMYYYYQRNDSIIGGKFTLGRLDKLEAFKERENMLSELGLEKAYTKTILLHYYELWNSYKRLIEEVPDSKKEQMYLREEANKLEKIIFQLPGRRRIDNIRLVYPHMSDVQKQAIREEYGDFFEVKKAQEEYLFPFAKIEKGSKVALYAAGNVGKSYYKQLMSSDFCDVVTWVDKKWTSQRNNGYPVDSITYLLEKEYDYLVIAIKDEKVANSILCELQEWGIEQEKIIWEKPIVLSVSECVEKNALKQQLPLCITDSKSRFVLLNTPDHGNLGDHLIALATLQWLKDNKQEVVEVTGKQWDYFSKYIKNFITPKDVILINGGGYMGDLWLREDERVKDIIRAFPKNCIVFMPQTFFYQNTIEFSKRDREFYDKYPNVFFIHRDKYSYDYFVENIVQDRKRNLYAPDMALYLKKAHQNVERKGVLLCFRNDKEKVIEQESVQRIVDAFHTIGIDYSTTDTVVPEKILPNERQESVKEKMEEFSRYQLVITDRLHGMIFATITGTPCIAVNNVSKKVEGVYQWINEEKYVTCVEMQDVDERLIRQYVIKTHSECCYQGRKCEFEKMMESMKKWINKMRQDEKNER